MKTDILILEGTFGKSSQRGFEVHLSRDLLRLLLAGMAMAGLMSNPIVRPARGMASDCLTIADALLARLEGDEQSASPIGEHLDD